VTKGGGDPTHLAKTVFVAPGKFVPESFTGCLGSPLATVSDRGNG
jgi:hypothetical protein